MTISGILQNRLSPVPDYYMPGRAEIELGTNVLKGGRTEAANGDPATKTPDVAAKNYLFGPDGITFSGLLDVLNPLQHLPMIAEFYRSMTRDKISPGARLAGGALYGGGPWGFSVHWPIPSWKRLMAGISAAMFWPCFLAMARRVALS